MRTEDRIVTAPDGVHLFARVFGEATDHTPVVCIPGLTRNSRDFTRLAVDLASHRLVAAVDLRGRGRSGSDPTAASYHLGTYADDVLHVVDELGLGRVAVVGTSLGGLTAIWMGARRPLALAGIVLNDIGPELQPEGAARIASYAGKLLPVGSWDEAVAQTRFVSEATTPDLTPAEWLETARQRYREEPDGRIVLDHDPNVTAGPPAGDDPWLMFERLAGIPLLLMRGELTDLLAPATVEAMRALRPDLEVVGVPGRGHAPTLDEPVARAAIDRFLATLG